MATSRSALGRGLSALLPSSPATPTPISEPVDSPESGPGLRSIPVGEIDPNPEQPRRHFDAEHPAVGARVVCKNHQRARSELGVHEREVALLPGLQVTLEANGA